MRSTEAVCVRVFDSLESEVSEVCQKVEKSMEDDQRQAFTKGTGIRENCQTS